MGLFLVLFLAPFGCIVFTFIGLSYYRKHGTKWDQTIAFALQMVVTFLVVLIAIWMGITFLSSYFDIGFYWTIFKICAYLTNWALYFLKDYAIYIHWPSPQIIDEAEAIGISTNKIAIMLSQTHKSVVNEIARQLSTEHPNIDQLEKLETLAGALADAIRLL